MIGAFAITLSLSLGTIRRRLTNISHYFHHNRLQGMWGRRANTLNSKGDLKTFRIAETQYRSYLLTSRSRHGTLRVGYKINKGVTVTCEEDENLDEF